MRLLKMAMLVIIGGVCATSWSGCSRFSAIDPSLFSHPAPTSERETGIVLQADPAMLETFLRKRGRTARLLNSTTRLYEVFDTAESEIRSQFPNAFVEKNHYIAHLFKNPSKAPTPSNPPAELSNCTSRAAQPQPKITVLQPKTTTENTVVELGESVSFSASSSLPTPHLTGPLRLAWVVQPPALSTLQTSVLMGQDLTFQPDALGPYTITLLAQDSENACNTVTFTFLVTENPDFLPSTAIQHFSAARLQDFYQLDLVRAPTAWQVGQGANRVIAIIDTGVNYNHVDLSPGILLNKNEIPANLIDDDANGFVDDVIGWDFVNSDNHPFDDAGHGTHVAGLAAATSFGMAPQAKILVIKALNGFGGGDVASIAAGIMYAVDRGAHIINASFGSYSNEFQTLQKAVDYSQAHGVLFIAASGNGDQSTGLGADIDDSPLFPAALMNENILSVAAVDELQQLTAYSNYGLKSTDLAAPGGTQKKPLLSTCLKNPKDQLYVGESGTSMATPIVAGVAALVWGQQPDLTAIQIKAILMTSGHPLPALHDVTVSGRSIDAAAAMISRIVE